MSALRALIVEDDVVSRRMMEKFLSPYLQCTVAVDGEMALDRFCEAYNNDNPFKLVCLDINMPKKDGQEVLADIRAFERDAQVAAEDQAKVIMTTSASDPKNVISSYERGNVCAYLVKPVSRERLLGELEKIGLMR
ncbi:MAG: response regulator [Candidatus Hydrogenedentes bacterium]|nr:response regulator [Candidatus Hydrogenedentota bacterium]